MKPVARTDRLIRQVVGQETLVYDPSDDTACCLNPLATLVWRQCDGTHTVEEIATVVQQEMSLRDSAEAEEAVWRVLDELEKHHLLKATEGLDQQIPRRDVLKALALLPFFPAIQQITAPSFATGASPAPSPTPSGSLVSPSVSMSQSPTQSVPGPSASASFAVSPTPSVSHSVTLTPSASVTPSHS
jgi:hypothetical protein